MKALILLLFVSVIFYDGFAQDVSFAWAKQIGGIEYETGNSIAKDAAGNIYTVGSFRNAVDFDPGSPVFSFIAADYTLFISKLDPSGNFVWAKQVVSISNGFSSGNEICIDPQGNIYVTGDFSGTVDFDPGPGIFNLTANTHEIFALKLDMNGNFAWAKQLGVSYAGIGGQGVGTAIRTDPNGNVYIAGTYYGLGDFDPGSGVFNLGSNSASAFVFIAKLDINGNLVWARSTVGGTFAQRVSITLDNAGNVYATGGFNGITDFDPGPAAFTLASTAIASTSIFIFKLNVAGNYNWAKMMEGGPGFGASIIADNAGYIYSTGKFAGVVDFDPGPGTYNLAYTGTANIYLLRLTAAGDFVGARQFGGNSDSEGTAVAMDAGGNLFITGTFSGTVDFDPGIGVYELSSSGFTDMFVAKINIIGNLDWAVRMGGSGSAKANAILADAAGNIYSTGFFDNSVDFDFSPANYNLTSNGNIDIFIHKMITCSSSLPVTITVSACTDYTLNGQTYTASGVYTQFLTNTSGCDSNIVLNLTIGALKTTVDVKTCADYSWNGNLYSSSGTYSDTLITASGCDSVLVLNLVIGSASFSTIDTTICPGENYDGYSIPGIYTDILVGTNGCDSTRTLNLTVKNNCIPISIPNAFTPNRDKTNDIFKPTITETVSGYGFVIYNRYGQKVFETKIPSAGWDGTWQGKDEPQGSYIYFINYKRQNGYIVEEKGTVLLFR